MGYEELRNLAESYPPQGRDTLLGLARQHHSRHEREILELAATAADVGLDDIVNLGLEPDTNPLREAFKQQYPNVSLDSLRGATEERLGGLANGVKGKLFEIMVAEKLNAGESVGGIRLGPGEKAHLFESSTHPGADLYIVNEAGETVEELQLKATDSISYVKGALEQYPDISVIVPQELGDDAAIHDDIVSAEISNEHLGEEVGEQLGELSEDAITDIIEQSTEFAFDAIPGVSAVVIGLIGGRQVLMGRFTVEESLRRGTVRLGRASVYSVIGAGLMAADAGVISIPTVTVLRIAEGRVRHRMAMERHLEEKTSEILRQLQLSPASFSPLRLALLRFFAGLRFIRAEVDKLRIGEERGRGHRLPIGRCKLHSKGGSMRNMEPVIEDSGVVEDVHHLRLMALLHELVREKGNRGAAFALGIDPRTAASCMKMGRLSWRVREALERGLQSGAGSAGARQQERNDALEGRIEEMKGKLRSGLEDVKAAVAGEVKAVREEHARAMAARGAAAGAVGGGRERV